MNWQRYLRADDYITVHGITKRVYWNNGKLIGTCHMDVDGYWKFGFLSSVGLWEGYDLEAIAAMLKDLNSDWDREIQEYFANERLEESRTSDDAGSEDEQRD